MPNKYLNSSLFLISFLILFCIEGFSQKNLYPSSLDKNLTEKQQRFALAYQRIELISNDVITLSACDTGAKTNEIKSDFYNTVTSFASAYQKDQRLVLWVSGHFQYQNNFFSELFQLENERLSNKITAQDYVFRKTRLESKYITSVLDKN